MNPAFHGTARGEPRFEMHGGNPGSPDRKSTRLNSSHVEISYAVFCLKKKKKKKTIINEKKNKKCKRRIRKQCFGDRNSSYPSQRIQQTIMVCLIIYKQT